MANQIQDFGEKIGGAKKDLWKIRGLNTTDLEDITDREILKFVTKDNIFPVPDYVALVENGMDPVCAYYIKEVRNKCGAKLPKTATREDAERFIAFLTDVKEVCLDTLTISDAKYFFNRLFINRGYYTGGYNGWTEKARKAPGLDNKLAKFAQLGNSNYKWSAFEAEAKLQNFPYDFDKNLKGVSIKHIEDKGYCLASGWRIISEFYPTEEALMEYVRKSKEDRAKSPKKDNSKGGSRQIVRPQLAHIQRTGPDVRNGKNITGEDILNTFKFRGGEFGNWNTQDDRQACLNYSYEALCDLAYTLNLPATAISKCGGDTPLAIAFGARGSGMASAHFEPTRVVINLTKLKGAGSLAHEWGHFLDLELGALCGGDSFLSNISISESNMKYPTVYAAFKHVMDVITSRPMRTDEIIEHYEKNYSRYANNLKIAVNNAYYYFTVQSGNRRKATEEEMAQYDTLLNQLLVNPTQEILTSLFTLYSQVKGKVIPKSSRDELEMRRVLCEETLTKWNKAKKGTIQEHTPITYTDYVEGARALDSKSSKAYFTLKPELFARAFECFIYDTLGFKSYYLVYGVHNNFYDDKKPYPEGEERLAINNAFKQLFDVIRLFVFSDKGFSNPHYSSLKQPVAARVKEQPKDLQETNPKCSSTKYNVTDLAELRKLIAEVPTWVPANMKIVGELTHRKALITRLKHLGIQVTVGPINKENCCGLVKSYNFTNNIVTLDEKAPSHKQLQGLAEVYILTLSHQKGGVFKNSLLIEGGILTLCKAMGLDVRIYCKSAKFNQLLNNPTSCQKYIETLQAYFK